MNGRGRVGGGFTARGAYRGGSSGSGGRGRGAGRYTNPCLTMHQPWASLLVYGIKRIEGRSWPSPITGRLWIHAASKVPDEETIRSMENFYREIYAINGITDIKFPEYYPVSRLLGCVEVVGCLRSEQLASWEDVPESVRLEGLTDFCWLCESPQRLLIPFEMRGNQGVYNLERRIYDAAVRGLTTVQGPLPVKFPLPDPTDRFSLRPGSLSLENSPNGVLVRSDRVNDAIAGARAAATQFSRNYQGKGPTTDISGEESATVGPIKGGTGASIVDGQADMTLQVGSGAAREVSRTAGTRPYRNNHGMGPIGEGSNTELGGTRNSNSQFGGGSKLLVAALRDLKSNKVDLIKLKC